MNVQGFSRLLLPVVLLGALAMTLHGFAHMPWPACIPFAPRGLVQITAFLVGSQIAILVVCHVTGRPPWMALSLCALLLAAAAGALWALLWAALCALAFVAVGDLLMELVRWPQDRSQRPVIIPLAVGSVAFGSAFELVGSLSVVHPATSFAAIALPLVVRRQPLLHIIQDSLSSRLHQGMSQGWLGIGECIAGSLVLLYFVTALFPEGMHDALVLHLAIPAEVALHGQWHYDFSNHALAMLPKHANWLYSIGYVQGGETCARLMNAGYIVASGMAISSLTRLGTPGGGTAYALLAFALYLSTPLTYTEASCLFVESVWCFYTLVSLLVLLTSRGFKDPTWAPIIMIATLLCGTWATKPQGLVASAALAIVMMPLLARHARTFSLGGAFTCAGAAALIGLAPYVRSWLVTGNPVFPFFNGLFKARGFAPHNFDDIRWHAPVGWSLLYDLEFHTNRFIEGTAGAAGFQWLLLVPVALLSLIASRNRVGIVLILSAALSFGAMFAFSKYLRYVFPSFSICTAAIAIGLSCIPLPWRRIVCALALTCIAANVVFIVSASRYQGRCQRGECRQRGVRADDVL